MLRERNLELIFDQHNTVNRQFQNGALISIAGVVLLAFIWYWPSIDAGNLFGAMLIGIAITGVFYGLVLIILAGFRIANLPQVDDLDEPPPTQPIFQQETRPVTIRVEHINDNQMQIKPVDLDMEQSELDQFALAIRNNRDGLIGRMAITKRLIKHRTNIKNVDGRYRHWFRQLREADAIQDISGTWYLTDVGEAILYELSPTP